MIEQIKELARQAWAATSDEVEFYDDVGAPNEDFHILYNEKFAELIIRECASVVFKNTGPKSALNVLQHFGVSE